MSQTDGERDELKRILLETNPYYLALTMGVSLLHTVFDLLAFKNDIGFWQKNKSMEGLSARTVIIQASNFYGFFCLKLQHAIIFIFYVRGGKRIDGRKLEKYSTCA